jgi:tRNA A37 threonylcarbamoyladenosine dehydratase
MCPACWELRGRTVQPQKQTDSSKTLLNVGLGLGVIALVPGCLAMQIGSTLVNIIALVRAKEPPARDLRWRSILGLCLTGVGAVGSFVVLFLLD